MTRQDRPAPGVVHIRLTGHPADTTALAAVLAGTPGVQVLTGPDGPYPSRRQPGHRLYLTLRLTPATTTETGGIPMTEPAIDDAGYAEAAAEDRAEARAVQYEEAQADADAEARYLAVQADRAAELDARQMDAQHQDALAENQARNHAAEARDPEAGL